MLRLLSEQKDQAAKGCWQGDTFVISTSLSNDELQTFFCEEYAPTPIVAPWNGGSGFYLGDATSGMDSILESDLSRFSGYRDIISEIKSWPEIPSLYIIDDLLSTLNMTLSNMPAGKKRQGIEQYIHDIDNPPSALKTTLSKGLKEITLSEIEERSRDRNDSLQNDWQTWWKVIKKARTKCNEITRGENKKSLLPLCRARLSDSCLKWLDAVYALQQDGKPSYNPLLGTGGNEGRLDLSNNFMQRLATLFISCDPEKNRRLFSSSAFNTIVPDLIDGKIGQYDPGRAGGYNQGMEIETKNFKINPWDFILAVEGALVPAGAVVRRNPTDERSDYTTPFTVRFSSVGFSSSAYMETGRRKTWLPVWRNPASYKEVKYLFGEGRTSIGRKVAHTGIEFSRAVGTLGVDRGIESFERYAFLVRRGQSYVALPAGRIKVRYRPELELLNELDNITSQVGMFLRDFKNIPATFLSARQNIDEAIFTCCQKPEPCNFCNLVRAIGNLEKHIAMRDRSKEPSLRRPLIGLSPRWIGQCDDGGVEVRIAAALASIRSTGGVGTIRSNMAGVSATNPYAWSAGKGDSSWYGNSLSERFSGVLARRLMDAERRSAQCVPIEASLSVSSRDAMAFLYGECDETKIEELLWGFTLVDWRKTGAKTLRGRWGKPVSDHPLSRAWCLLKLLHIPFKIRDKTIIKREPRIVHLLLAGRIRDACAVAIQRLHVSELNPLNVVYEERIDSIRLLASLLIPVWDQRNLESLVLKNPQND